MRRRTWVVWVLAAAALAPAVAPAQPAEPACPATPAKLPPELAGWNARAPLRAATKPGGATLPLGKGVDLALLPTAQLRYAATPERPPEPASRGGLVDFTVDRAGRFRVALGSGAWVDVVQGGKAVVSTGHGHGPDCSGVRKMVDYRLAPGRYLLQLSGSAEPTVAVMVTRLR